MEAQVSLLKRPQNHHSTGYSSNSDSDDDNKYEEHNHFLNNESLIENQQYRNQHGCSSKQFKKLAFCGIILIFLVLVYIPLSNNVQTRIGEENTFVNNNCMNCSEVLLASRIVAIPGWNFNTSRDTVEYVIPNVNTTIIDPVHLCNGNRFFLLIVVCSSSNNFDARQSIRETWGNVTDFNYPVFKKIHSKFKGKYLGIKIKNWEDYVLLQHFTNTIENNRTDSSQQHFSVKIVFLIGQTLNNETQYKINNENELNNDIIQESFIDSYNNLTLKSIMMLKWVTNNCLTKVKFVMKCDDDIFLNVPNLLHILLGGTVPIYNATVAFFDQKTIKATSTDNRLQGNKKVLFGFLFCHAKPIADVTSKWYSPIYMYSGETYPNYLSGTGYVMSMDSAVSLYNVSLTTPLFHLEDIYITGICASKIKLKPHHHPLFIYNHVHNPCSLKGMITQHQLTPEDIRKAYEFVMNTNNTCPPPDIYFNTKKIKPRKIFCH